MAVHVCGSVAMARSTMLAYDIITSVLLFSCIQPVLVQGV